MHHTMMIVRRVWSIAALLLALVTCSMARGLPVCDTQVLTRNRNRVSMKLQTLSAQLNQQLKTAHASFQNLQLTPEGDGDLKVSGRKNGDIISISGPLQVTKGGKLQLHAKEINKNGSGMKGIMDLFGKDLSDYVNLQKTKSVSIDADNLVVNADRLLGLQGRITAVQLKNESLEMQFASPPCRSRQTRARH